MSAADLSTAMRGCAVRLHVDPAFTPSVIVAVAATHDAASPAVLLDGVPKLHALCTHDEGVTRPDPKGRALMAAALEDGGTAMLGFESMADALVAAGWCRAMAEGGAE